ncbi:MAG: LytR C-terminal domain-containing protein [Mycobacterium sp.]
MNERVPDSSGLPLRAMVMVLLFLGVIFLLVGFQAMSSGGDDSDDSSVGTVATTTTTTTTTTPAVKADVRVFNISGDEGAAARVGDRLREAGWNVTETGNLTAAEVPATTVYFGTTAGEEEAAAAVGRILDAPVQPRVPEIAEQPPGVIVLVTG